MRSLWVTAALLGIAAAVGAASLSAPVTVPRPGGLAALGGRSIVSGAGGQTWVGLSSVPVAGGPKAAAEIFLGKHARDLGAERRELELVAVHPTKLGAGVKYRQRLHGFPVLGARVTVSVDNAGRVRAASSTARPLTAPAPGPWLAPAAAIDLAVKDFVDRKQLLVQPASGPRGVAVAALLPHGDAARPVYVVRLRSIDPLSNWHVTVDAVTGEVLHRRNVVFEARNSALVWRESPGGDGTDPRIEILMPDLADTDSDTDGGLDGNLVEALICCRYKNCDAVAKLRKFIKAILPTPFGPIERDVAWCNETQRASNSKDGRSDYIYAFPTNLAAFEPSQYVAYYPSAAKTPLGKPEHDPRMSEGESDVMAEVMDYWHTRDQYRYFRDIGDPALVLRDQAQFNRPLYISGNFLVPDFIAAQAAIAQGFGGVQALFDALMTLVRVDNAAFVPKGTFLSILDDNGVTVDQSIQDRFDRDSIMMFQGAADFAWDGDVIRHEFGHAAIWTVADPLTDESIADAWGIFVPPGSMGEGYADYFALAALGEDPVQANYVGPRMIGAGEAGIRALDNAYTCPTVIENEVHQDSQHFSAALWEVRGLLGGGDAATEKQIDEAVYDGMVTGGAVASFEAYGESTLSTIQTALGATAAARARAVFTARGVIGCKRTIALVDGALDGPIVWQAFARASGQFEPYAPGPTQYNVALPVGATRVELTVTQDIPLATCISGNSGTPDQNLQAIWKKGTIDEPIVFTFAGGNVSTAGTQSVAASTGAGRAQDVVCSGQGNEWTNGNRTWTIDLAATNVCAASVLHMALANYSTNGTGYSKVRAKVTVDAAAVAACSGIDAGPTDAGPIITPGDGGPEQGADAGPGAGGGGEVRTDGCGCGSGTGAAPIAIVLALLGLALMRRSIRPLRALAHDERKDS